MQTVRCVCRCSAAIGSGSCTTYSSIVASVASWLHIPRHRASCSFSPALRSPDLEQNDRGVQCLLGPWRDSSMKTAASNSRHPVRTNDMLLAIGTRTRRRWWSGPGALKGSHGREEQHGRRSTRRWIGSGASCSETCAQPCGMLTWVPGDRAPSLAGSALLGSCALHGMQQMLWRLRLQAACGHHNIWERYH